MTQSSNKKSSKLASVIFGFIFAIPGLGIGGFFVIPNLYDWIDMQDWQAVPAQLQHVGLRDSSDKSTNRVLAKYHYQYQGQWYSNNRVGIANISDNIGGWQYETYVHLKSTWSSNREINIWVDPDNPAKSIIDRELRWGLLGFMLIFVLLFGGLGIGIIVFTFKREKQKQVSSLPLWQTHANWKHNRIYSDARSKLWYYWGFALFWNAISSPVLFSVLPRELGKGNYPAAFILLFPLVGLFIIFSAIKHTLGWRRFGRTPVVLDPFPSAIGDKVGGYTEIKIPFNPKNQFNITLSCVHVYKARSGSETKTREKVLWHDEQQISPEPGMRGTRVRFDFTVPQDLPESGEVSDNYHKWVINIDADLPGIDFDRSFIIPAFRASHTTIDSSMAMPATSAAIIDSISTSWGSNRNEQAVPVLDPAKIRIQQRGNELDIHYPLFRNLSAALGVLVMGLIFSAIASGMYLYATERSMIMLFIVVFGLVGSLVTFGGLYMLGNSLQVHVSSRGITSVRKIYGIASSKHAIPADIAYLDKSIGMQSQSGNKTRTSYRIKAITQLGHGIALGDGLSSATKADYVLKLIADAAEISYEKLNAPPQAQKELLTKAHRAQIEQFRGKIRAIKIIFRIVRFSVLAIIIYFFISYFL